MNTENIGSMNNAENLINEYINNHNNGLVNYMKVEFGPSEKAVIYPAINDLQSKIIALEKANQISKEMESILQYVLQHDDGVGICLGYQSREMIESVLIKVKQSELF